MARKPSTCISERLIVTLFTGLLAMGSVGCGGDEDSPLPSDAPAATDLGAPAGVEIAATGAVLVRSLLVHTDWEAAADAGILASRGR